MDLDNMLTRVHPLTHIVLDTASVHLAQKERIQIRLQQTKNAKLSRKDSYVLIQTRVSRPDVQISTPCDVFMGTKLPPTKQSVSRHMAQNANIRTVSRVRTKHILNLQMLAGLSAKIAQQIALITIAPVQMALALFYAHKKHICRKRLIYARDVIMVISLWTGNVSNLIRMNVTVPMENARALTILARHAYLDMSYGKAFVIGSFVLVPVFKGLAEIQMAARGTCPIHATTYLLE